jgi:hypothetical protein
VARAKRTDRTDARRRYRAEQSTLAAVETDAEPQASAPSATRGTKSASPSTPPQQRPSIVGAFKGAMRPLDLGADLRAAPRVLLHWGVLAAVGIAVASSVLFVISLNDIAKSIDWAAVDWTQPNPLAAQTAGIQASPLATISQIGVQMFVVAPGIAGAFLIGFTAKRASWLGGLFFGIVATACFVGILATPVGNFLTSGGTPQQAIASTAAISPIGAAVFASVAAWYRRFLELANPNRNQRQQQAQRKPQGRGDMKPARR